MKILIEMTTGNLRNLKGDVDRVIRINEQWVNSLILDAELHRSVANSLPGMRDFRNAINAELYRRDA